MIIWSAIGYTVCSLKAAAAAGGVYGSIVYVAKLPLSCQVPGTEKYTSLTPYSRWSGPGLSQEAGNNDGIMMWNLPETGY